MPRFPTARPAMTATRLAILSLCIALAACSPQNDSGTTSRPSAEGTTKPAEEGSAGTPADAVFDQVRLEERPSYSKKGMDWVVRASLRNGGSSPLEGGDFVIELRKDGESQPFAVHGTQVFFSPGVPAGKSTAFMATIPGENMKERPALSSITASVQLKRRLRKPQIAPAWKPLDPTTATPKVVGATVIIGADGQRRTVPATDPVEQQGIAEASNPFKHDAAQAKSSAPAGNSAQR